MTPSQNSGLFNRWPHPGQPFLIRSFDSRVEMVQEIRSLQNNIIALEMMGAFTTVANKVCLDLIQQKVDMGFQFVNLLFRMDENKTSGESVQKFFRSDLHVIRSIPYLGHLAIVIHLEEAHIFTPLDQLFFNRSCLGWEEQYFDISKMFKAWQFVSSIEHEETIII